MNDREALKAIIEDGINLGAGDYVDVEALKVAASALKERIDREENEPTTNAERIRKMTDDELAVFLWEFDRKKIAFDGYGLFRNKLEEWLKQPAED